jgi:hypothetical protein
MRVYSTVNHLTKGDFGHGLEALCALFPLAVITLILSSTSSVPPSLAVIMSQTTTTVDVSSRFQAIFQAALKSYQKQTKADLLAHPLLSRLQSCDDTAAIVAILQDQLRDLDKSRSADKRLTKWLNPTVNVLSAFSATISGGVSLVSRHVILVAFVCIFFYRYFHLRV